MILGEDAIDLLQRSHVAVFGLGGVGSYAVEALARAGVGELTLIDSDCISRSNINRQLPALHSTVGLPKVEAVARRCRDINPDIRLHLIQGLYQASDRERFWGPYDYVADAIDLVSCKLDLIESAFARNIPIISALGTGNKLDATQLTVTDIAKTQGCALARVMRKELRNRGILHTKVVYSPEEAAPALALEEPPPGRRSVPASVSWVPSCAGLIMGGTIVMDLLEIAQKKKEG